MRRVWSGNYVRSRVMTWRFNAMALAAILLVLFVNAVLATTGGPPRWIPLATFVGFVLWAIYYAASFREREAELSLDDGRLTLVAGARTTAIPLSSASLSFGKWQNRWSGVQGSVAHLEGEPDAVAATGDRQRTGRSTLRIAMRGDVLVEEKHTAPAVEEVDAYLEPELFEDFVAALKQALAPYGTGGASYRSAVVAMPELSVELLANPAAPGRTWASMAVWMGTIVAVSIVGFLSSRILPGPVGLGLVVTLVVMGLAGSIWVANRRPGNLRLVFSSSDLELRDAKQGRVLGRCHVEEAKRSIGQYVVHHRGTYVYPTLTLTIGSAAPVRVGLQETRFGWRSAAPTTRAGQYLVGGAEWPRLVSALGLEDELFRSDRRR